MNKKLLGLLLAMCLVISLMTVTALAVEESSCAKHVYDNATDTSCNTCSAERALPVNITVTLCQNPDPDGKKIVKTVAGDQIAYFKTTRDDPATEANEYLVEDITASYVDDASTPWNIRVDNCAREAIITFRGAYLSGTTKEIHGILLEGDGSAKIVVEEVQNKLVDDVVDTATGTLNPEDVADSVISKPKYQGIRSKLGEGLTITGPGKLLINMTTGYEFAVSYGAIHVNGGLTLKDANIEIEAYGKRNRGIMAGSLIVDGGVLNIKNASNATVKNQENSSIVLGTAEENTMVVKNGAKVSCINTRGNSLTSMIEAYSIDVENAFLEVHFNRSGVSEYKMISDGCKLNVTGGTAQFSTSHKKTPMENVTDVSGISSWRYLLVEHTCSQPADDGDCLTAVVCGCGKTVYVEAKTEHIVGEDDHNCVTATLCGNPGCAKEMIPAPQTQHFTTQTQTNCAVAVICENEGCQAAAIPAKEHTPVAGEYECSQAHPCAVCTGNYREAGVHKGGGTPATCLNKAVCVCGEEFGELGACAPEADDGDCTTAIKCSLCKKETTPAISAHKYTDNTDTTCDNTGCTHTRKVENGGSNPQTGDVTPIVLFVALASVASLGIVATKKRAI